MFKNPFSFEGRIRRSEYILSFFIFFAFVFIVAMFVAHTDLDEGIRFFFLIPGYWFGLSQGAKRCHDLGNSGWYQIIPFYGLWMIFEEGDSGINKFGLNPKGFGNPETTDNV